MLKIGIFFGGQSREREISFAGGRTVYDNLDKNLFEPVPVFVDSLGNFILLDWKYVYKGTIRDFYPPVAFIPAENKSFQLYIESLGKLTENELDKITASVGKRIFPHQFTQYFEFAFLALHGPYGEDGDIQGLLEWYQIPYSGSGILPSAIGVNKPVQKDLMPKAGFPVPAWKTISRKDFIAAPDKQSIFETLKKEIGLPMVIKSPNQGSSIGVSILKEDNIRLFSENVYKSLFIKEIQADEWTSLSQTEKEEQIRELADIRSGIGLPVKWENEVIYDPNTLLVSINQYFKTGEQAVLLENLQGEQEILFESFLNGQEFSCVVIRNEEGGVPIALPPTQIIKGGGLYDYRSKYLPGMSRKITPIDLPETAIQQIRSECERLYNALHIQVYARIDGFYTPEGRIFLNDPNTTSGMMPSSFFFHQAAEIGLNPSQFLTYIIRTSLKERLETGKNSFIAGKLLEKLNEALHLQKSRPKDKVKVGVIMGGYSTERHISVESGRNVFEKLSSSTTYAPVPFFLTGNDAHYDLYQIPVNIMLKDNADDIREKVLNPGTKHPVIQKIIEETNAIRALYTQGEPLVLKKTTLENLKNEIDEVFIALHGRPGEDGNIQTKLQLYGIPYNGSGVQSSSVTINKYETNERLLKNGFMVAAHRLVYEDNWLKNKQEEVMHIEKMFPYPFIAKPADDGCSSAVKKIKNREELVAFSNMMFRDKPEFPEAETRVLHLKAGEEFPMKTFFLIEELITKGNAVGFLEITGGMLTRMLPDGGREYEVFEPSETLSSGEVLSLEEKFLAGEGQNITPARFSPDPDVQAYISKQVKDTLKKVAQTLDVEGYCRIDAFVRIYENNRVETIIIEINSLPGMTPATCIFHQSALNGYKPYDFIDAILKYGREKQTRE